MRIKALSPSLACCGLFLLSSCSPAPVDENEVARRVAYLERAMERIHEQNYRQQWERFTGGTVVEKSLPGSGLPWYEHHTFADWRGRIEDPALARKVELLHRYTLLAQVQSDPAAVALMKKLERTGRMRSRWFEGAEVEDADLDRVIRLDPDRRRRRLAWERRHLEPGREMQQDLARLFAIRNKIARSLGYEDYYRLHLDVLGLDPDRVDRWLHELDTGTAAAAGQAVTGLAENLPDGTVRPWDEEHAHAEFLARIESHLDAEGVLPRVRRSLLAMGFRLDDAGITVDATLREGRSQHFFTFPVEVPGDVRVLVTPASGFYAHRATFHEFGHALYYASATQPDYILRLPPGRAFSEGVAKIFERLPYQPSWLAGHAGIPDELAARSPEFVAADELMRIRRFLAGCYFERDAYADPDRDLETLYEEIASTVTFVDYREGPGASWASTVHYTTQPLANLQYIVARLIQAQVYESLRRRFGTIIDNREAGDFIRETIFRPGASRDWEQIVLDATGEPLGVEAYLRGELGLD